MQHETGPIHLRVGRLLRSALFVAIAWGFPGAAVANGDPAYCERVRADAASDAALLFGPRVSVQALRVPTRSNVDSAELFGGSSEYQLRGALSWSLANAYAGLLTLRVAEADCERHAAQASLADLVREGSARGAAPALQKALAFLDQQREGVEAIEAQAEVRHARHLSTVVELDQVQSLALQVQRTGLEVARQIALLDENSAAAVAAPQLVERYASASERFEESASDLRSVRQWDLSLRGGVIPGAEADWFGTVELSYNLGGLFQIGAENRYLAAREAELRNARYELPEQARRVEEQLAKSDALLREELTLRERELELLERRIGAFETSDSPQTMQALAVANLRRTLLRADVIYARELLAQRNALTEVDEERVHAD